MFWEEEKECMSREDLEQVQLERLQSTLYRVGTHVPFYRNKFFEMKVDYESLNSLEDLRQLPFTTKQDLRDNYPYGLFAVPLRDVVRIHSSSGTTGMATVVGYTRNDISTWSTLVARILTAAGVGADDVIQIAFGYGLFTGGFGLHYGAEKLGASVIPISSGQYQAANSDHAGFQDYGSCLHPLLCLENGRYYDGYGYKSERLVIEIWPVRCGTMV